MNRWCQLALVLAIIACMTGQLSGGAPRAAPELDPEEVFRKAYKRLVDLEPKHDLLKTVSEVKPAVERDEKGLLKSARFVFGLNTMPPGKEAAQAKDDSKPFFYASVELWSGRTPTPPGGLHEFEWQGQTYQVWVRVYGSDVALVKTVRKSVDESLRAPPVPEPPKQPSLRLQVSQPLQSFREGQPLVFEGLAAVPIHRPGPEHFKITRVTDGEGISLRVDYDRESVEKRRPNQVRGARSQKVVLGYNSLFKGTRLFLYNGIFGATDPMGHAGILDLYGCPELEPSVRYRVTWACWPIGANQAVDVFCEFELNK
jgi:hypothetical protein